MSSHMFGLHEPHPNGTEDNAAPEPLNILKHMYLLLLEIG